LLAIDHLEARLIEFDARLSETAEADPNRERVGWLRCFRGIDTLTAMLILAELTTSAGLSIPGLLMAYLGLVPGEDSSGEKQRRGRITRTGNTLVKDGSAGLSKCPHARGLCAPSPKCLQDPGGFERTRDHCRERQWPRN
jgi:transposase